MRLACVLLALPLVACASSPDTSTGHLARASDLDYQCDDSAHDAAFACGVKLAFDGDQVTATGVYKDGTAGGPDSYVLSLVRDVQGCSGSHIAFTSCTPNTAPQL